MNELPVRIFYVPHPRHQNLMQRGDVATMTAELLDSSVEYGKDGLL
jgi:hypothetical protein